LSKGDDVENVALVSCLPGVNGFEIVVWLRRGSAGRRMVCETGILKTFAKEASTGDSVRERIV
jgi:hypothetical protein